MTDQIMESAKELIITNLKEAIKDLTGLEVSPQLERPLDERHGDYSTNIAMVLFKDKGLSSKYKVYGSPLELAKDIEKILNTKYLIQNTDRVEAVAPGFINFWLSKEYLISNLDRVIKKKEKFGRSSKLVNEKIMVEFTDPNPFKEFHIGHLYSNAVGECLARLMESQGAIVKRANYQGDVGMHVAKALYGLLQKSKINPSTSLRARNQKSKIDKKSLEEKVKFLGQAYALGVKAYEEDENAKKEIEKINKQIYEQDSAIMPLYQKGREWSLEYFETIYKRLGTKFDYYYFESQVGNIGLNLVNEHLKKGVFVKSNGAVIFSGEKYGLHNRVFINSLGIPTYEAKDLGLAPTKYKDFSYDLSIIVTAQEQSDYFKVVLKALSKIAPKLAQKTKHIAHGVVRLPMGKMSSRTGTVITGEWLLDEAKRRIQKEYKEMDQETAEKVAVGAVKYALLKSGIGRDIAFGFEESINLEGNSGPYLQYTYARTQSVLAKINPSTSLRARNQKSKIKISFARGRLVKLEGEEVSLMRGLSKFPEIVEQAGEKFVPNLLCNYLFDLSQKFNLFYQKIPILHPGVNVTHPRGVIGSRQFRLALTMAVGQVIKNGLYILGIESPGKM